MIDVKTDHAQLVNSSSEDARPFQCAQSEITSLHLCLNELEESQHFLNQNPLCGALLGSD